jgi:hypothetical protein
MEIELTAEQKQKSVLASYDSLNLITELRAKENLTDEEKEALKRNEQHIRIMLTNDWFTDELTAEQKTELSKI